MYFQVILKNLLLSYFSYLILSSILFFILFPVRSRVPGLDHSSASDEAPTPAPSGHETQESAPGTGRETHGRPTGDPRPQVLNGDEINDLLQFLDTSGERGVRVSWGGSIHVSRWKFPCLIMSHHVSVVSGIDAQWILVEIACLIAWFTNSEMGHCG